ncbi:hypothetical protein [Demequina maris]|uniref:hypothetical protein n=1 Tax=Demequina maris TaxID=1638982 RepID=UPI000781BDF9|nr:hypothetical protein [Demequina maris]
MTEAERREALKHAKRAKDRERPSRKLKRVQPDDRGDLKTTHLQRIGRGLGHLGVFDKLRGWQHGHDQASAKIGAPEKVSLKSFVILLSAIVEDSSDALLMDVAQAVRFRLTKDDAAWLGVEDDVYALKDDPQGRTFWDVKHTDEEGTVTFALSPNALYDRMQSAMDRLSDLIEPFPGIATRAPRPINEVEADIAALDPTEIAEKRERLLWLMNAIVQGSIYRYNREVRHAIKKHWRGSLAIDGTKLAISASKFGGGVPKQYRNCNSTRLHHSEAMAGWYVRLGDHGGFHEDGVTPLSSKEVRDATWALEVHIGVMIDDEHATKTKRALNLAVAVSIDTPGARIGENSLTVLKAAHKFATDNDISPGTVVGDRAVMPNAKYAKFKKPARQMGYKFCHDYTTTQLGKMQGPLGSVQVEGQLCCPGISAAEVNATKAARKRQDTGDEDADAVQPDRTYAQQLQRRQLHITPTKGPADAKGKLRISCPASDPRGGVSCPLREQVVAQIEDPELRNKLTDRMNDGKTRRRIDKPPVMPGEICTSTQLTHTVELDDTTGKYYQDYDYKSAEWHKMYGQRNQVETFNKDVKANGMSDTKRRRVRGFAKQGILAAMFAAATNVKRINAFLAVLNADKQTSPKDPGPAGRPRRGHSTSVRDEDLPPPDQIAA